MTLSTCDSVTSMSCGTPRHKRQVSFRVTFADDRHDNAEHDVIYCPDVSDDIINDAERKTSTSNNVSQTSNVTVTRSTSSESRDNPFHLNGELQRKADFILQHSTISRRTLHIADPDEVPPDTDATKDHLTGPLPVQLITENAASDQHRQDPTANGTVVNRINKEDSGRQVGTNGRSVSDKEHEQEPGSISGLTAPCGTGSDVNMSLMRSREAVASIGEESGKVTEERPDRQDILRVKEIPLCKMETGVRVENTRVCCCIQ